MSCLYAFSRAWRRLHVFATGFDWLTGLPASLVIGQSNYFGFGFSTLNWKTTLYIVLQTAMLLETVRKKKPVAEVVCSSNLACFNSFSAWVLRLIVVGLWTKMCFDSLRKEMCNFVKVKCITVYSARKRWCLKPWCPVCVNTSMNPCPVLEI